MFANLSTADRYARLLIAIVFVWFAFTLEKLWLLIPAVIAFIEFFIAWDFVYAIMGRSTCPLPDPNRPWYQRLDWLAFLIGVPLLLFCLWFVWMAFALSMAWG